jgi:predicted nucleotide-binding protein (sugar kinase/HSP70/actin superfamily)
MPQSPHYKTYRPSPLTREDRARVTILFGGVTWKHERLAGAALRNLGYRVESLPECTRRDFETGKELVDPGACCPTYFTAGCLANALREKIAREGRDAVARNYVFVTASGCGACRFGQYLESYALALEAIGLPDLRIYRLEQDRLSLKSTRGQGLEIDAPFMLGLIWAMMVADLLGELEHQARPYEARPGDAQRILEASMARAERAFLERPHQPGQAATILWFLASGHFERVLREIAPLWAELELDRLRVKPRVKITGEIWVKTQEGEGNYNIKRWLEQEGAEVLPMPMSFWLDYLLSFHLMRVKESREALPFPRLKQASVRLTRALLRRAYERLRHALLDLAAPWADQDELVRLARPFYSNRLNGGEAYMLIGEALHAHEHKLAHMICELAPYACMPSTMSVGAMANVLGRHPDLLYAPIEIKGDAEIHALSRCQMILTEAKRRAQQEFQAALSDTGLTLARIREWERTHPEAKRFGVRLPHAGAAGTAARYVRYVAHALQRRDGVRSVATAAGEAA